MQPKFLQGFFTPDTGRRPLILIRAMVGGVFLVEGILKVLHPDELGAIRYWVEIALRAYRHWPLLDCFGCAPEQ